MDIQTHQGNLSFICTQNQPEFPQTGCSQEPEKAACSEEKPNACLWDHQFGNLQARKSCDRGALWSLGFASGPCSTHTTRHNM